MSKDKKRILNMEKRHHKMVTNIIELADFSIERLKIDPEDHKLLFGPIQDAYSVMADSNFGKLLADSKAEKGVGKAFFKIVRLSITFFEEIMICSGIVKIFFTCKELLMNNYDFREALISEFENNGVDYLGYLCFLAQRGKFGFQYYTELEGTLTKEIEIEPVQFLKISLYNMNIIFYKRFIEEKLKAEEEFFTIWDIVHESKGFKNPNLKIPRYRRHDKDSPYEILAYDLKREKFNEEILKIKEKMEIIKIHFKNNHEENEDYQILTTLLQVEEKKKNDCKKERKYRLQILRETIRAHVIIKRCLYMEQKRELKEFDEKKTVSKLLALQQDQRLTKNIENLPAKVAKSEEAKQRKKDEIAKKKAEETMKIKKKEMENKKKEDKKNEHFTIAIEALRSVSMETWKCLSCGLNYPTNDYSCVNCNSKKFDRNRTTLKDVTNNMKSFNKTIEMIRHRYCESVNRKEKLQRRKYSEITELNGKLDNAKRKNEAMLKTLKGFEESLKKEESGNKAVSKKTRENQKAIDDFNREKKEGIEILRKETSELVEKMTALERRKKTADDELIESTKGMKKLLEKIERNNDVKKMTNEKVRLKKIDIEKEKTEKESLRKDFNGIETKFVHSFEKIKVLEEKIEPIESQTGLTEKLKLRKDEDLRDLKKGIEEINISIEKVKSDVKEEIVRLEENSELTVLKGKLVEKTIIDSKLLIEDKKKKLKSLVGKRLNTKLAVEKQKKAIEITFGKIRNFVETSKSLELSLSSYKKDLGEIRERNENLRKAMRNQIWFSSAILFIILFAFILYEPEENLTERYLNFFKIRDCSFG